MKIYQFPTLPIQGQLFHTPGAAFDGGITSGGAQVITPEPGGFAMLEIDPAVQFTEWESPVVSWLMSKVNGQAFRIRLAPSPQIAFSKQRGNMASVPWAGGITWSNQEEWDGDFSARFAAPALKGTLQVVVDLAGMGQILRPGHVIGHWYNAYKVDEIDYAGDTATILLTNPLRRDVAPNDQCPLRPWFTGRIADAGFRTPYTAEMVGHIKPGKIIMHEALV